MHRTAICGDHFDDRMILDMKSDNLLVVAVSDGDTAIYNRYGVDVDGMITYYEMNQTLHGFDRAIKPSLVPLLPVDILIRLDDSHPITVSVAISMVARLVFDVFNHIIDDEEVKQILDEKGTMWAVKVLE